MPMYKFRCKECGKVTRKILRKSDKDKWIIECECGGEAHRQLSTQAVHYKGNGFYNTDYKEGEKDES